MPLPRGTVAATLRISTSVGKVRTVNRPEGRAPSPPLVGALNTYVPLGTPAERGVLTFSRRRLRAVRVSVFTFDNDEYK